MLIGFLLSLRPFGVLNNEQMTNVMKSPLIRIVCVLALTFFGLNAHGQAEQLDPGVAAALERAQGMYEGGRALEALTVIDDVLRQVPGNPEARFLKGLIFADMGNTEGAIEIFAGLTSDYPELPEPWNNLAVLFAENGDFDKARQALLAAIQTHPSYSTAHENLGDLYARMAGMAYDRALEQDRGNESARLKLSAVNGLFSMTAPATSRAASVTQTPLQAASTAAPPPAQPEPTPVASTPVEPEPVAEPAPATPAPEPVQVATAAPPPAAPSSDDVAAAVRDWASAWSAQDVDGYLNRYASSFQPSNGASLSSWMRYRRERLTAPSFIRVDISDLDVRMNGARSATATFMQRYRSDNYEDRVRKTLSMALTTDGWQIVREESGS